MSEDEKISNLPAQIADALAGIPKALIPASFKAIDRLVGAAVDIPVAYLAQKKAKIDAQSQAFSIVENSIAQVAASEAAGDEETVQHALHVLVRKEYRKQVNREAVATAMVEDLRESKLAEEQITAPPVEIDEDWLNVFERYAEDASTERMQGLWGRVLAGEVRKPGRYSTRTLRFLSEFSQADGLNFSEFSKSAFGDAAPKKLATPDDKADIRTLIYLESAGIVQGASGLGFTHTIKFDAKGNACIREGNLVVVFKGKPNTSFGVSAYALTPLGQELLSLIPNRDTRAAARNVALAMKTDSIESAYIGTVTNPSGQILPMEIIWQNEQHSDGSN